MGLSLFLSQFGAFIASLSLRQCHHIGGNVLSKHRAILKSLEELDIIGCAFTLEEVVKSVAGLESLVSLKMDAYTSSRMTLPRISPNTRERFVSTIAQLHSLVVHYRSRDASAFMSHTLNRGQDISQLISYTALADPENGTVQAVNKFKHLTSLEVFQRYDFCLWSASNTELVSNHLSNSCRLSRFGWSSTTLSHVVPRTFPSTLCLGETLKSLRLAHSCLNDSVCSVIADGAFELKELDLSWTCVTSDGLVEMSIGKIACLKKLWLGNTQIFYKQSVCTVFSMLQCFVGRKYLHGRIGRRQGCMGGWWMNGWIGKQSNGCMDE